MSEVPGSPHRSDAHSQARRAELATSLAEVRARIDRAAQAAGRDPASITLVVITKTWPADDVRRLADLGVTDVGENRDQEAAPKAAVAAECGLRMHFVGQLQTNKARSVAHYADVVESVDRHRLVTALDRGATDAARRVTALLQVALDPEPGRGGADPADLGQLAAAIAESASLDLGGVMAVAPQGEDPLLAFERLRELAEQLQRDHPLATTMSAGMSGDLEAAISCGATHVRVGSAVLGHRPVVG